MSWVDVGRPKKSVAVRSRANILIPYLCEHHLRFPAMAWKMRNPFAIPATRGLLKAKGLQTSVSWSGWSPVMGTHHLEYLADTQWYRSLKLRERTRWNVLYALHTSWRFLLNVPVHPEYLSSQLCG